MEKQGLQTLRWELIQSATILKFLLERAHSHFCSHFGGEWFEKPCQDSQLKKRTSTEIDSVIFFMLEWSRKRSDTLIVVIDYDLVFFL